MLQVNADRAATETNLKSQVDAMKAQMNGLYNEANSAVSERDETIRSQRDENASLRSSMINNAKLFEEKLTNERA